MITHNNNERLDVVVEINWAYAAILDGKTDRVGFVLQSQNIV